MGSKPGKITPESFNTFFLAERPDGRYDQYHSAGALLPMEVKRAFGSQNNFISRVFEIILDVKTPRTAWFVYDRIRSKVAFFTEKTNWQPNLEMFEPLLCYRVDPYAGKYETMRMNQEVWKRVIWAKMEERLAFAMRQ